MNGTSKGQRRVELFRPFKTGGGEEVTALVFQPVTAFHLFRWETGEVQSRYGAVYGLMSELTGLMPDDLMKMTFPDVDFVMADFIGHLPEAIRVSIREGNIPEPAYRPPVDAPPEAPPATIPEGYNDLGPIMEQMRRQQEQQGLPPVDSPDPTMPHYDDDPGGPSLDLGDN